MTPSRRTDWVVREVDEAAVESVSRACGLSALFSRVLVSRGLANPESVQKCLSPNLHHFRDPLLMRDMKEAVGRVVRAISAKEKVVVFGDYDVDGVSACAILYELFKTLGLKVRVVLPERLRTGYGLKPAALDPVLREEPRLVVTVDCGISSPEAARVLAEKGIDLVVTDHHEPTGPLPEALAVVDPKRPGCPYPFKGLSGAGIALKLAWAVSSELGGGGARALRPALKRLLLDALGLAALGTIADVAPLVDENRVIAHWGLESLSSPSSPGLKELLRVSRLGSLGSRRLSASNVSFGLAPRLNAGGRTGSATRAFELLVTRDGVRARELAEELERENRNRQEMEDSILREALGMLDGQKPPAIVLAGEWHPGVIGIVASRLAERYGVPCALVALDGENGRGSSRGVEGFDLKDALEGCSQLFTEWGGHERAAGFSIPADRIDELRAHLESCSSGRESSARLKLDGEVIFPALTIEAVRELELLAPFGHGNPRPVFAARKVQVRSGPSLMGRRGEHINFLAWQGGTGLRTVGFRFGGRAEELAHAAAGGVELAFRPKINAFAGREKVELELVDFKHGRA